MGARGCAAAPSRPGGAVSDETSGGRARVAAWIGAAALAVAGAAAAQPTTPPTEPPERAASAASPERAASPEVPAGSLPPVVLWIGDDEPLRSEQRRLEALAKKLSTRGAPVTVTRAQGPAEVTLRSWLSSPDSAARATLPLAAALGGHRAAVVVWLAPPKERIGQTPIGFGVLGAAPPHEVLWVTGTGPVDALMAPVARLLAGVVK